MSALGTSRPQIDSSKFLPSEETLLGIISSLKSRSQSFADVYSGRASSLSPQQLSEALEKFHQIAIDGSKLTHISEFVEHKYPLDGAATAARIAEGADAALRLTNDFFDELLMVDAGKLESLSEDPQLKKYQSFFRFLLLPSIRTKHRLPQEMRAQIAEKLQRHGLNRTLDDGAFDVLKSIFKLITDAADRGYTDPSEYGLARGYLTEGEAGALQEALESNKQILREYTVSRKLSAFNTADSSGLAVKPGLFTWQRASEFAISALYATSPELGRLGTDLFKRGIIEVTEYIDAYTVMTCPVSPPFMFVHFEGSPFETQEVCHEVGHAVHFVRRGQSGEMRTFNVAAIDELLPDLQERQFWHAIGIERPFGIKNASAMALDNVVGSINRCLMADKFQKTILQLCNSRKAWNPDILDRRWSELMKEHFVVNPSLPQTQSWRGMKAVANKLGNNLSYVYAQLVSERMWQEHLANPIAFERRLLPFLDAGGSDLPGKMLSDFGFNTSDPKFWDKGFDGIREAVRNFPLPAPAITSNGGPT
jgi:oligoendopeptidase F